MDIEQALQHVADLVARTFPCEASCGVTLMRDGRHITVASSDQTCKLLDEIQHAGDDGPGVQATRTGRVVVVHDFAAEPRWGDFPSVALAHGARGSYSHPLIGDGRTLGALNLYVLDTEGLTPDAQDIVACFAELAAILLSAFVRQGRDAELAAQLREALASRSIIDQAIGVIMAQRGCDAEHALAVLRTASQQRALKLRDIAANIVTGISGRPPVPGRFDDPGPLGTSR